jgi:hypothetical protein
MDCPACGLFNASEAPRCACGWPLDAALPPLPRKRPAAAVGGTGRHLRIAILIGLAAALAVVRILAAAR